jgi:hypothetical protein
MYVNRSEASCCANAVYSSELSIISAYFLLLFVHGSNIYTLIQVKAKKGKFFPVHGMDTYRGIQV